MRAIGFAIALTVVSAVSVSGAAFSGRSTPTAGTSIVQPIEGNTLSGNYLFEVVKRSKPHAETLSKLLRGQRGLPAWVRNMVQRSNYVTAASSQVMVEGVAMELFSACQAHNCTGSELKALFSADGKTAYLRISDEKLGELFLGDPGAAQKAPLMANGL